MATTSVTEQTGVGGTQTYAFTFAKLKDSHIRVDVNGVNTTDFTVSGSNVVIGSPTIVTNDRIRIYRVTPVTVAGKLTDVQTGASLTETDLDTATTQNLYVGEEARDELDTVSLQTSGKDTRTDWDAKSKKITSVTDGTAATDACTKGQLDLAEIQAGNLPTVGGGDNDSGLFVNAANWAVRTPAQIRNALSLTIIRAAIWKWRTGGTSETLVFNQDANWAEDTLSKFQVAPGIQHVNSDAGDFTTDGFHARINANGTYLLIGTVTLVNTDNVVRVVHTKMTSSTDGPAQVAYWADSDAYTSSQFGLGANASVGRGRGQITMYGFVDVTLAPLDLCLRMRVYETAGSPVVLAISPSQLVAVKIA